MHSNSNKELEKELQMLKDYNNVLEAENRTRNEERKALEAEIQRLAKYENQVKHSSVTSSRIQSCSDCSKLKIEIVKHQSQAERMHRQIANLQAANKILSENLAKNSSSVSETKHRELFQKYEEVNFQNLNLKKQIESLAVSKNDEKMKNLQRQKTQLLSKIISFESEIEFLKSKSYTTNNKQAEIRSLENKIKVYEADKTQLGLQINSLNLEIKALKDKINNQQLSITTSTTKQVQYQSQIRSLKLVISNKESEISSWKTKAESSSNVTLLEKQIMALKDVISRKESQIRTFKSQIQTYKNESNSYRLRYEGQIKTNEQYVRKSQAESSNTSYHTAEISRLNSLLSESSRAIKEKENKIRQWERKDEQKNQEVKKFDSLVNSYLDKITFLEMELKKLENQQIDEHALSKSYMSSQAEVIEQNVVLNEKIIDLERRILILEETNQSLRQELRINIEERNHESRISWRKSEQRAIDEELLTTIKLLKTELENSKAYNGELQDQNMRIQAKLSQIESENVQKSRRLWEQNKYLSQQLQEQQEPMFVRISQLDETEKDPQKMAPRSPQNNNGENFSFMKREKKRQNRNGNGKGDRSYGQLQKKIDRLKSQNAGLKKHLYN